MKIKAIAHENSNSLAIDKENRVLAFGQQEIKHRRTIMGKPGET